MIVSDEWPRFDYTANTTAMLMCQSMGGPNNTFSWSRTLGGRVTGGEFGSNVVVDGEILVIPTVEATDGGEYTCEVNNVAGSGSDSITITGTHVTTLITHADHRENEFTSLVATIHF